MRTGITGDVVAVVGTLVVIIVVLTLVSGGSLKLGTASSGPYFNLGFTGPQAKGG
jgi:hypothetical protein